MQTFTIESIEDLACARALSPRKFTKHNKWYDLLVVSAHNKCHELLIVLCCKQWYDLLTMFTHIMPTFAGPLQK